MSLDDATCSHDVEYLLFPSMSGMSFVPMFRRSSLADHVPLFFCFPTNSLATSHCVLVDSRVLLFSVCSFACLLLLLTCSVVVFSRCYQRSIMIISLVFYFTGIKQLFPFIGSSLSDIMRPGYGSLVVQEPLDVADRPILHPFHHSAYVIRGSSSLSDTPFSRESHRKRHISCTLKIRKLILAASIK